MYLWHMKPECFGLYQGCPTRDPLGPMWPTKGYAAVSGLLVQTLLQLLLSPLEFLGSHSLPQLPCLVPSRGGGVAWDCQGSPQLGDKGKGTVCSASPLA